MLVMSAKALALLATTIAAATADAKNSPAVAPRRRELQECWGLDIGRRIALSPEEQQVPICLDVGIMAHTSSVEIVVEEGTHISKAEMCLQVQSIETVSRKERAFRRCAVDGLVVPIGKPNVSRAYLFSVSVTVPVLVVVEARTVGTTNEPPMPPFMPGEPMPPPAPNPRGEICDPYEQNVLIECAADAQQLGCLRSHPTPSEEIECLEINLDRVSGGCRVRAPHRPHPAQTAACCSPHSAAPTLRRMR